MKGYIREVFTSIQGEGIKVGQRMTFVRFSGCNLKCKYCDTTEAQVMEGPLYYRAQKFENPVAVDFFLDKLDESTIAITGGEPLLQVEFLQELLDRLKASGGSLYLDTNGSLPEHLDRVVNYFETVCLDFKIPSATGFEALWPQHEKSLAIAAGKEVFVKAVVDGNLVPEELDTVCSIVARIDKSIPLVIQPVFGKDMPDLLSLQRRAMNVLDDVRVIPQIHKYLNIR